MSFYLKGGIPYVRQVASGQTNPVSFPSETIWLSIGGAQGSQVFFSQADFDAQQNYITVPASGEWSGPVRCLSVWVAGGGTIEVVGLCLSR